MTKSGVRPELKPLIEKGGRGKIGKRDKNKSQSRQAGKQPRVKPFFSRNGFKRRKHTCI